MKGVGKKLTGATEDCMSVKIRAQGPSLALQGMHQQGVSHSTVIPVEAMDTLE